jgi:hypothetical protein
MPVVEGWMKVSVWVPPERPGFPEFPGRPETGLPGVPDQGLPPYPDQGLPPGGEWPGVPERPGQPLPRPPRPERPVYPVVPDPEDLGGHPELPDLNMTRRIKISDGADEFTGYVLDPEPPQVEEGYEPRFPTRGLPGSWVAVLYVGELAWAWVRTPGAPDQGLPDVPGFPDREPKRG